MDARLTATERTQSTVPDNFTSSLLTGLSHPPKEVCCKYLYDEEGSRLFEAVCELPEYYPTRTEIKLLTAHAAEIAALIGPDVEIVEFGAGSLRKVRILLDAIRSVRAYTPIDISSAHLDQVTRSLAAEYPALKLRPIASDFTKQLIFPPDTGAIRRVGFFPGSTIGNFRPSAAQRLLGGMRAALVGGGLLVGVDLVKDPALLHAAYNDEMGVTAAFNKNLLSRANRELAADFDLDAFVHYAPYNAAMRRIEMYLVSTKRQIATVAGRTFTFDEGEAVHTEDSCKYTVEGFRRLAKRAGFDPCGVWYDQDRLFSIHWLAC